MPEPRRFARFALFLGLCALALGSAQSAFAAESCIYDPATKAVTASIDAGSAATLQLVGGQIWFGFSPAACGDATSTNTDSIAIAGASGTSERLVIDQRNGTIAPGATSEFNIPEIEITTTLGDATDHVVLYATNGDDAVAAGQFGVALNSDGDVDITFTPTAFELEVYGLSGNDHINARGQGGAGLHFLGPVILDGAEGNDILYGSTEPDELFGGPGDDTINAQASDDLVEGNDGNDRLSGAEGADTMIGGAGSDEFYGGYGADTILQWPRLLWYEIYCNRNTNAGRLQPMGRTSEKIAEHPEYN